MLLGLVAIFCRRQRALLKLHSTTIGGTNWARSAGEHRLQSNNLLAVQDGQYVESSASGQWRSIAPNQWRWSVITSPSTPFHPPSDPRSIPDPHPIYGAFHPPIRSTEHSIPPSDPRSIPDPHSPIIPQHRPFHRCVESGGSDFISAMELNACLRRGGGGIER